MQAFLLQTHMRIVCYVVVWLWTMCCAVLCITHIMLKTNAHRWWIDCIVNALKTETHHGLIQRAFLRNRLLSGNLQLCKNFKNAIALFRGDLHLLHSAKRIHLIMVLNHWRTKNRAAFTHLLIDNNVLNIHHYPFNFLSFVFVGIFLSFSKMSEIEFSMWNIQ